MQKPHFKVYIHQLRLPYQNTTAWEAETTEMCFLTVLEAVKPTVKVLAGSGSGESSLRGLQMATFLPCPYMAFSQCMPAEKGNVSLPSSSMATKPIQSGLLIAS